MNPWHYTKLIPSFNLNELGKATQVDTVHGRYEPESKKSIESVRSNQFLPEQTNFPDLKLYPSSKFTDIIYPFFLSGHSFLLSKNAIEVLSELNLDVHQIFPCTVYLNNEAQKYLVIYFPMDRADEILDWHKCFFSYWKPFGHIELDRVVINSQKEFHEKWRKLLDLNLQGYDKVSIRVKTLKLKQGAEGSLDFLKTGWPVTGFYVSPRFVDAVSRHKLTGFAFEDIEDWNREQANVKPWPNYKPGQ